MKKLALFVAFIALSFAVSSCTKETPTEDNNSSNNQWEAEGNGAPVNATDIDTAIVSFVNMHVPETSILSCNQTEHYFRVILNDNTKVYFNQAIEWVEVNCEQSTIYGAVPATLVPEQIAAYVTANYPDQHIDEIERENNGWEIELSNDVELKFDANFNVIGNGGGNGGGTPTNYVEINTFVETYFSQVSILKVEVDEDEYEVKLSDGTEITFNLAFEWKSIDCDESNVYGVVPAELVPEQISAYVATNYPNQHIDKIEKRANGWEIELNNGVEIEFDSNFNVIHIDNK